MPGDAFLSREDIEAIESLQMEHQRAPLPDGPLRDEMSTRADLKDRFEELTRCLHRPTPPLQFIRRFGRDEVMLMHTPTVIDGQCVEVVTPGHQCWAFHNPGVWPWVARCVLDPVHTTTGLVWPHRDANGRTWID